MFIKHVDGTNFIVEVYAYFRKDTRYFPCLYLLALHKALPIGNYCTELRVLIHGTTNTK
jgi:hypothetical protein